MHAITVWDFIHFPHADAVHDLTGWADCTSDKAFLRFFLCGSTWRCHYHLVRYAALWSLRPLWRNSASMAGSRPRNSTNSCIGDWEPPLARMASRKARPVSGLSTPSSSKRENASADNTSAHL